MPSRLPSVPSGLSRALVTYGLPALVLWLIVSSIMRTNDQVAPRVVPYAGGSSSFLALVQAGSVEKITESDPDLVLLIRTPAGGQETVIAHILGTGSTLIADVDAACAAGPACVAHPPEFNATDPNQGGQLLLILLTSFLPILVILGVILYMSRRVGGMQNQILNFGRSKARMSIGNKSGTTFADVAGVDEAKAELQEIVEFLKFPEKFTALGARIPRGVLLLGPPGCGKTILAKAVAGEAGVPFFNMSGSEFVEMLVGVGAARMRDTFSQAKRAAPAILFIDEIDAVGRQRGAGIGGGNDEKEQTLNQILTEMDGFEPNTNVIVIGACNRPDVLDPALLRPGRFDRQVILDRPDIKGRVAILAVHAKGKPLASAVDLTALARRTPGFSGADLANLLNEAAILAARRGFTAIGMSEILAALDRIIAGPERNRLINDHEKLIIAYHEGGHALVQHTLPKCDPVSKVSIISRGRSLGHTISLPSEDRYLGSRLQFEDQIAGMLGGAAAEQLVFGEPTTGAADDLEKVTTLARRMVMQFGMSDALGPQAFGQRQELIFLGREISEQRNYSDDVARQIDVEIRAIIDRGYARATSVLTERRDQLEIIAEALIAQETLEAADFAALFAAIPPRSHGQNPRRALPYMTFHPD